MSIEDVLSKFIMISAEREFYTDARLRFSLRAGHVIIESCDAIEPAFIGLHGRINIYANDG